MWQLNLDTLAWSNVTSSYEVSDHPDDPVPARFPATAAAVALPHRGRILLIGGHVKQKDPKAPLAVRVLDPTRSTWSVLHCGGDVPLTRGSHVASIIGDTVFVLGAPHWCSAVAMLHRPVSCHRGTPVQHANKHVCVKQAFVSGIRCSVKLDVASAGGESPKRQLQAGLQMLDLQTNEWSKVDTQGECTGPPPASGMVMTAYQDRYLLVFGGGAVGHCNNATYCFDTATGMWDRPAVSGQMPAPRAGCSAALLGHHWYVFGGGNNTAGCPDMWMLDLRQLGVGTLTWQQVCTFDTRSSLASEGGTAIAVPALGLLLAFGGYNGVYHNAVSAFKPAAQQAVQANEAYADVAEEHRPRCAMVASVR